MSTLKKFPKAGVEKPEQEIKTVGELLEAAADKPELLDRAYRKVWKVYSSVVNGEEPESLSELKNAREKRKFGDQPSQRMRYPLFANELFDIDIDLSEAGEFFREASAGGAMEKRILEIVGETGVGKTTWMEIIAAGMEEESFFYLSDCEHHENPLNVIPSSFRKAGKSLPDDFRSMLEHKNIAAHLNGFRGRLCRRCEERVQKEFGGKWENFPVGSAEYRLGTGVGMLQVEGSLAYPEISKDNRTSKIPDEWYRVVDLANGGVLFIDLPAQHKDFCGKLSRMVSDGRFKDKDLTDWWPDVAIVSISNRRIKEVFSSEKALVNRVISVTFHMALDPNAELKIQHKDLARGERGFHFVPWVEEAGCHLLAISRLEPDNNSTLKLKGSDAIIHYSGGVPLKNHSLKELRSKRPADGTRGITMREGGNLLAASGQQNSCVGLGHLMTTIREYELGKKFDSDTVSRVKEWITLDKNNQGEYELCPMEEWYQDRAVEDLVRGFKGNSDFDRTLQNHFGYYLENVEAYLENKKIKHPVTKEELSPDEGFMKSIEERMKIIGSAADEFRKCLSSSLKGNDPDEYPPLKEAIVKKIISEVYDDIKRAVLWNKLTPEKDKLFDPNRARRNLDKIKAELLNMGYLESCCWNNLLSYAQKIFSK